MTETVSTIVAPEGSLEVLSQHEVERLRDTSGSGLHDLLRRCALAVLNCGTPHRRQPTGAGNLSRL
jgi:hypothetical protein